MAAPSATLLCKTRVTCSGETAILKRLKELIVTIPSVSETVVIQPLNRHENTFNIWRYDIYVKVFWFHIKWTVCFIDNQCIPGKKNYLRGLTWCLPLCIQMYIKTSTVCTEANKSHTVIHKIKCLVPSQISTKIIKSRQLRQLVST
jgi:hypothetical protein